VRPYPRWLGPIAIAFGLIAAGCSSSPSPGSPQAPPQPGSSASLGPGTLVSGASDSVGAVPGSDQALYVYRFRQIDPSSDRFTFQDRDLSFYMKPTPDAIHFQIENRQDRPIVIDWERSSIIDPWGHSDKVAHQGTNWSDRFGTQSPTTVAGLQRFGDYVFPMSYLVDPGSSGEQLHKSLFPEDSSAPQYTDKTVSITLSIRVEDRPREYSFQFKAASVIPR
jgi:hypothetical protein